LVGVADRGGEADPLQSSAGQMLQPFKDGQQVPASVVSGEGMQLVDDDDAQVGEQHPVVDVCRDEHRLERLGCGE
jgi:hypothetical protein